MLTICQNVMNELSLKEPSSIIGSTSADAKQLLAHAHRTGDDLLGNYLWPQLERKHTITLVSGTQRYEKPTDFDRWIPASAWDQTNNWTLRGPITPQEAEWRLEGIVTSSLHRRYWFRGAADAQIYINPTPASSGDTLSLLYQSTNWVKPRDWATSTTFTAASYCWNDGNIYYTTSGGTTGGTAPTHTSGSSSDGGVTWTYQNVKYATFVADTDESLIDEKLIEEGIKWRFLRAKGLPYQEIMQEYYQSAKRQCVALRGSKVIYAGKRRTPYLLSHLNVPDTGYGGV